MSRKACSWVPQYLCMIKTIDIGSRKKLNGKIKHAAERSRNKEGNNWRFVDALEKEVWDTPLVGGVYAQEALEDAIRCVLPWYIWEWERSLHNDENVARSAYQILMNCVFGPVETNAWLREIENAGKKALLVWITLKSSGKKPKT